MEALLGRGRARLESEDWDGALEDFAAARALWPALMEPVLFLGKTYLLKGNAARCEELFQGLYDRDRARDEVAIRVGTIYRELGDLSRGLAWAERASRSAAREVLRSSFLFRMGKLEEAAAAAEEALKLEPGNKKAHNTLGNALARQGKIDEAVAAYQEAIRLDPRSAAAYTNLGEAERLRGNLEEAVTAQSEAIRFEPSSATAHHNLGITLRGLGRLGDAAAELRRALELDPRAARTHNSLANVLYAQKKVEEATREFREAIRLEPRYMTARFNLGRALAEEGESEQAFEVLKEALSISDGSSSSDAAPTVSRPTLTHLLDDLSKLAVKVGRKEEALAYGKRLLELKRERAGRARAGVQELNEYAWALLTVEPAVLRDPQAGLAAAKEAAERSRGKDPASLDTLALAHFLTGDLGSAVEAEEKAIQLMPASREGGGSSDQRAELEENLKRYRTALAAGVKTAVPGKAGGSP
jgi:tetratricopeptide (TPR) repeat protein